jgi:hypothetical protein
VPGYAELGEGGVATDDPLTAYRRANVYPPTSRPLTREQDDLIHPNKRHETAHPMDGDADVTYLFTADRYFAIGDDRLTATLDVRKSGAPVPVQIAHAFAVVQGQADTQIPLVYANAAGTWTTTFAPATLASLHRQTSIAMYIEFDAGHAHQRAHFDFQYTPATGIPARFTGAFTDEVIDGSLVIHAGVEVARAGAYVIDCNLYTTTGEPIGWSRFKGNLGAGQAVADLSFFGKVIADANAAGPFQIGELRGARYDPGVEPDLEQMAPFTNSYQTEGYPVTAFSDVDYDSPAKQRMIQMLQDQQAKGTHQGAAGQPR